MIEPYVGEIRLFAGSYAPSGWALCNGQLLPIEQNAPLFSLLGVSYGGDGRTTFALPDLRDASPVGVGPGSGLTDFVRGSRQGAPTVTLHAGEMPVHRHPVPAVDAAGSTDNPSGAVWAQSRRGRASERLYGPAVELTAMAANAVAPAGGSQPHENMPPYLRLNFVIALQGLWPPRD
ncbi:MAG: phage tail protein [Cellulomonas sp.]|uniref:phage tail protein n=1 Tax=Cellulomonas sp. TaxID=40001 RepID=UPI0019F3F485|nr:tail fiber protein [Cellulomonas sp.]MBF0688460.1 phage tail protein [Cellulomonas sp.]